ILTELEVSCLPADLPEAIKVDLSKLEKGSTLTLKDIELPKGVEPMLHGHSAEDTVLVSVVMPAAEEPEADAAAGDAAPAAEGDKK
ncbi:MAG: 50S ribosomal protein L25, partial [Ottowia sp.]|nr:50S ribosomal protein L25 [Ottowia sp.]